MGPVSQTEQIDGLVGDLIVFEIFLCSFPLLISFVHFLCSGRRFWGVFFEFSGVWGLSC